MELLATTVLQTTYSALAMEVTYSKTWLRLPRLCELLASFGVRVSCVALGDLYEEIDGGGEGG
jgi:hypothetical protein